MATVLSPPAPPPRSDSNAAHRLLSAACREPLTPALVDQLKAFMVSTPPADVDAAMAAVLDSAVAERTLHVR